jgi:DNA-binding MurR/RpiR family transcriptional regulator
MSSLLKIRSERGQMSAIERRIADFILDNAQLMRDYSSQQLANTLKISQSSVVKFSQRLGFKGYPDLKLSISEALVREDVQSNQDVVHVAEKAASADSLGARSLWQRKTESEQETGLLNSEQSIGRLAELLQNAASVDLLANTAELPLLEPLALSLALLGTRCHALHDPALLHALLPDERRNRVVFALDQHGNNPRFLQAAQEHKAAGGMVLGITRNSSNALRNMADACLVVSAHDSDLPIEDMLYRSASQHLLDLLCLQLFAHEILQSDDIRHRYKRVTAPWST